jgi:hypothetical protein
MLWMTTAFGLSDGAPRIARLLDALAMRGSNGYLTDNR